MLLISKTLNLNKQKCNKLNKNCRKEKIRKKNVEFDKNDRLIENSFGNVGNAVEQIKTNALSFFFLLMKTFHFTAPADDNTILKTFHRFINSEAAVILRDDI